jgi:catechol 2,3-dioxygenase
MIEGSIGTSSPRKWTIGRLSKRWNRSESRKAGLLSGFFAVTGDARFRQSEELSKPKSLAFAQDRFSDCALALSIRKAHHAAMPKPVHANTRIGHIHLKVADLDRAIAFYRDVLGFTITQRYGAQAAFLSAGGYHHHIGLNTWESKDGGPPARGTTGLYHVAFLYPDRAQLADALRRVLEAGVPIDGAADHGVSEAIYLRDPDGNGVELYCDRPEAEWPRKGSALAMVNAPLDLEKLLMEAP